MSQDKKADFIGGVAVGYLLGSVGRRLSIFALGSAFGCVISYITLRFLG